MSSAPSLLTREEGTTSRARRRPKLRPSTSHVLIVVSAILAFLFNLLALQQGRGATELVAVADAPIDAGSWLAEAPIRWVPLSDEFDGLGVLVTKAFLGGHSDSRFMRSVPEGTPLDRSSVSASGIPDGLRIMSIPIGYERAAGTTLRAGDRVDAISMVDDVAMFVGVDLEVVGISTDGGGAFAASTPRYVLVAANAEQVLSLARAIDSGSLELVRSTGADPIEGFSR